MAALAPMRVVGPPPTAPPYGLVNTPGTLIEEADKHYLGGVLVDSYPTETPEVHDPCAAGTSRSKSIGADPPKPEFSSFTVYIPITCSGLGIGNEAGAELLRNRARLAFVARESFGVEHELAFGNGDADQPHLTDENLLAPGGGALSLTALGPREALAMLEKAIGLTAQDGFVHLDPATFVAMAAYDLFVVSGATMKTKRGNTVIIGNGYIGAQPGLTADQNWAFATGPVRLSRDEVEVIGTTSQSLNYETNELTFRAERNYVAYWDTALQVGVLVDRSSTP